MIKTHASAVELDRENGTYLVQTEGAGSGVVHRESGVCTCDTYAAFRQCEHQQELAHHLNQGVPMLRPDTSHPDHRPHTGCLPAGRSTGTSFVPGEATPAEDAALRRILGDIRECLRQFSERLDRIESWMDHFIETHHE